MLNKKRTGGESLLELLPKSDLVFQQIFGKEENARITERLLSLILKKEIRDIDLDKNKRIMGDGINEKVSRLDIRAKMKSGEDVLIEMQVEEYEQMGKREIAYWSKVHSRKVRRGREYEEVTPTIAILITGYEMKELKNIKDYHTIWNMREKENPQIILSKDIELHILEIPKVRKYVEKIQEDELAVWLRFLEDPKSREVKEMAFKDTILYEALQDLKGLEDDEYFEDILVAREMYLMDKHDREQRMKRRQKEIEEKQEEIKVQSKKIKEQEEEMQVQSKKIKEQREDVQRKEDDVQRKEDDVRRKE